VKPLLGRWEDVRRVFHQPDKVLWIFDFDGTLASIARHPSMVVMPQGTRHLLRKLVKRFPDRVGILSGRPISKIRAKVGVHGLIYGGVHGFEIESRTIRWSYPLTTYRQQRLQRLASRIRRELAPIPGLWMEDKRWTLCLHYSEVKPKDRLRAKAILRGIHRRAQAAGFTVQEGLQSMEIFSDARWDKGQAIRWLKNRLHASGIFYAGDDTTDEAVFRTQGRSDVAVHVGRSGNSRAAYFVARRDVSPHLLQRILTL
jgi:trehalose-phosphatase